MKNLPIDYIIVSNDDENLFSFLMFDHDDPCCDVVSNSNKKYFLKLKNQQYFNQTGETLFARLYNIINKYSYDICFNVMEKLLNEIGEVYDLKIETSIEKVLQMNNGIY